MKVRTSFVSNSSSSSFLLSKKIDITKKKQIDDFFQCLNWCSSFQYEIEEDDDFDPDRIPKDKDIKDYIPYYCDMDSLPIIEYVLINFLNLKVDADIIIKE